MPKARHHRSETFLDLGLARGGDAGQRAAMKGIFGRQNFVAALVMAEFPREFEEALVGLAAAVAKENLARPEEADQLLGQEALRLLVIKIGNVRELARLLDQRGDDVGRGVAQSADGDAGAEVQVAFAVDVPDARAFAALQGEVEPPVGRDDVFAEPLLDGLQLVPDDRGRWWQDVSHFSACKASHEVASASATVRAVSATALVPVASRKKYASSLTITCHSATLG